MSDNQKKATAKINEVAPTKKTYHPETDDLFLLMKPVPSPKRRVSDNSTGKYCGLGPVGFPKRDAGCRQSGGFPFSPPLSKSSGLNYHLVHTLIPVLSRYLPISLGVFLRGWSFSSLFCTNGFSLKHAGYGPVPTAASSSGIHRCHSRQATLHAAAYHMQVHTPSHS